MGWLKEAAKVLGDQITYVKLPLGAEGVEQPLPMRAIDVLKNDGIIVMCDALLQRLITAELGVDLANIIPSSILDVSESRIVGLYNLLMEIDVDELEISDGNGNTVLVNDYIFSAFQITSWKDYIDAIYKKLRETIYNINPIFNSTFLSLDEEANKMITCLAVIIGSNPTCTQLHFGEEQIINIPLDLENVNDTFTFLGNMLVDKGYIAESLRDNFTISGWMQFSLQPVTGATGNAFTNNVGFNNNGEFKYLHCYVIDSIINTNQHVWTPVVFATRKEIKPIVFEQIGVTYNNLSGYVGYKAHLYDKTTGAEDMTKQYMVWYGRNHGNDSGSSYQNMWYDMATTTQIWADGQLIDGADETYNVYYNGGLGRGNSVNYNELGVYVNFPIRRWNSVYVSSEMNEILLNNQYLSGDGGQFNPPNIDPIVDTDLTGNDIGMVSSDTTNLFLLLITNLINLIKGFIPSLTPFDTTHEIKIGTIKRSTKKTIDTDTKVTDFTKTNRATWMPLWQNKLVKSSLREPTYEGMCLSYYLNNDMLQGLAKDLWDWGNNNSIIGKWWDTITQRDPMETILRLIALPFNLIEDRDYEKSMIKDNTEIQSNIDDAVPILYGVNTGEAYGYPLKSKRFIVGFSLAPIVLNRDFTDYEPYTKADIWLPFLGKRTIDTSLIMNCHLDVIYTISLTTGDFQVELISRNNVVAGVIEQTDDDVVTAQAYESEDDYVNVLENYDSAPILVEFGNLAYPMTISGKFPNTGDKVGHAIQTFAGIGGMVSGSGGAYAVGSGVMGLIGDIAGNAVQTKGINTSDKWLGHPRPYITLYYHQPIDDMQIGTAFDETVGHKSSHGMRIGEMTKGYHKLKSVKMEGLLCTAEEQKMIKDYLMDGFYKGVERKTKDY